MSSKKITWIVGGALSVAVIGGGAGIAIATGSGDDRPLTDSALAKAKAAALAHTGGGTVVETEVGDDGSAYTVEIRLADRSQVEVNLDQNFYVIGREVDDDGPGDMEEPTGKSYSARRVTPGRSAGIA